MTTDTVHEQVREFYSTSSVAGRRYLVVGVGHGMGGHTATLLSQAGAQVACADIDETTAESIASKLGARPVTGDVTDRAGAEDIVRQAVLALGGPLDGVLDVVGVGAQVGLGDISPEIFEDQIRLNLRHALYLTQIAGAGMRAEGSGGSILFISSIVAQSSAASQGPAYAMAKAGLESLVRTAAIEYGPANVRVNAIAPGFILNDRATELFSEERRLAIAAQTPLRRLGRPEDIAAAATFLLSPAANFITGQVLNIDGGVSRKFGYDFG
jgi:NAD(P)-dependent dehydrogenase (short-subunit alcohol dehydrogenase family)